MAEEVLTKAIPTWCHGCYNYHILAGVERFFEEQFQKGKKRKDFAIVTGIGCHAKIFDYLNLYGINSLHGRVPPTCLGIKLAKPELTVFGFSGDGDAYAEGVEHLIHAARYNIDFKYIIHNNQVFALTLGEPTPVTEKGFIDRLNPKGNEIKPINPVKLMLDSGATFAARIFAEIDDVYEILKTANEHKGFAFIEIIQPCVIFHDDKGYKERFYDLQKEGHDITNLKKAMEKADEFDYDSKDSKIPLGIFYKGTRETFNDVKLKGK